MTRVTVLASIATGFMFATAAATGQAAPAPHWTPARISTALRQLEYPRPGVTLACRRTHTSYRCTAASPTGRLVVYAHPTRRGVCASMLAGHCQPLATGSLTGDPRQWIGAGMPCDLGPGADCVGAAVEHAMVARFGSTQQLACSRLAVFVYRCNAELVSWTRGGRAWRLAITP